jgi:hypothetical protein
MDLERIVKEHEQRLSVIEEQLGIVREKKSKKKCKCKEDSQADANRYKEEKKDKEEKKSKDKKKDKKSKCKERDPSIPVFDPPTRDAEQERKADKEDRETNKKPKLIDLSKIILATPPAEFFSMFEEPKEPVLEAPTRPKLELVEEQLKFLIHKFERLCEHLGIVFLSGGLLQVNGEVVDTKTYMSVHTPTIVGKAQHA